MDELDHNLLEAWDRVFERCRRDPAEARRRYERMRAGGTFDRPVRAWTVAVRASDTRIDQACMVPDPGAICAQLAHEIVLDGVALRQLGGAVEIPYPGVPIDEAAGLLGKHKEALRNWLPNRPGRTRGKRAANAKGRTYDDLMVWLQVEPTEEYPLGVRYVPQRTLGRGALGGGMETPVVWSDHALDPGASKGRPASKWWGTLWRSMAENIPAEFEQVIERVPRVIPYPSKRGEGEQESQFRGRFRGRFRGWCWRCPGLIQGIGSRESGIGARQDDCEPGCDNAEGLRDFRGCGRLVRTLYAPLPVWTIGRYLGMTEGLAVEGLSGQWYPGVMDRWAGRRSLACERCWKLRRTSFAGNHGWNDLVTYLSGGLLYGREVKKPSDFEYERRVPYRQRVRTAARTGRADEREGVDSSTLAGRAGVV